MGTDFSPEAHRAVTYAGSLAKALHAHLIVAHVDEKARFVPGSELANEEACADRSRMDCLIQELAARDVDVAGRIVPGIPGEGLCDAARSHEVDLVIVGATGRGCLAGVLLGGVAQYVLRNSPCPVLVGRNLRRSRSESDQDRH